MNQSTYQWLKLLLGIRCLLCRGNNPTLSYLCKPCLLELPWLTHSCLRCAIPLAHEASSHYCGRCLKSPPAYQHALAACQYAPPIRQLISQLKFNQRLQYAHILAHLLIYQLKQSRPIRFPSMLIPVPLHRRRIYQRGFNQALEIARPIAKLLNIPLNYSACERIRHTEPQSNLSGKQRVSNIKGAFRVKAKAKLSAHVAIIDDVMTTGHTVNELSKVLFAAGVREIEVWCCARAGDR